MSLVPCPACGKPISQMASAGPNCGHPADGEPPFDRSATVERTAKQIAEPVIQVKWVLIPLFCQLMGYSEKAVRRKIEEGICLQGKHYRKAPDGHVTMNAAAERLLGGAV